MRITKIKLAGFKSFVDPTTLSLPGKLTCVVGPNGCGKSNIIDAINWVFGESSAKNLRGDSMTDIIFNGSSTRKPVGQASVEIVLDNSDGTIGGQYAGYNEIAIKRQVNRDGTSNYFLNSVRCRRKDITSVFLGTGLGSRGYSIIEQGMISRVIEAKPEELRALLEEAAGISKYKERRRETENRIRRTTDNLDRVNDIRDELEKQLLHLQRQAEAAEKYNTLKADEKSLETELIALHCRTLTNDIDRVQQNIAEQTTAVEESQALLQATETKLAELETQRERAAEKVSTAQRERYEVSAKIDQTEQALKFRREKINSLTAALARISTEEAELKTLSERDAKERLQVTNIIETRQPDLSDAKAQVEDFGSKVRAAEEQVKQWQHQWHEAVEQRGEAGQELDALRSQRQQRTERRTELSQRVSQIVEKMRAFEREDLDEQQQGLTEIVSGLAESLDELRRVQATLNRTLHEARESLKSNQTALHEAREAENLINAELRAAEALKAHTLGADDHAHARWLESNALHDNARLIEKLTIEPGWEWAVEAAATIRLDAFTISKSQLGEYAHAMPAYPVAFVVEEAGAAREMPQEETSLAPLTSVVSGADAKRIFQGVYVATNEGEALSAIDNAAGDVAVVTKSGACFGRSNGRVYAYFAGTNPQRALSLAEQNARIATLARECHAAGETTARAESLVEQNTHRVHDLERNLASNELQRDDVGVRLGDARGKVLAIQAAGDQAKQQIDALGHEKGSVEDTLRQLEEADDDYESSEQKLRQRYEECDQSLAELTARQADLEGRVDETRGAWIEAQELYRKTELELLQLNSRAQNLAQSLSTYGQRLEDLVSLAGESHQEITSAEAPIVELEATLQSAIEAQRVAESTLAEARQGLGQCESEFKQVEKDKRSVVTELDRRKESLQSVRLEHRALETRLQDTAERLGEVSVTDAISTLPEEAETNAWEEKLGSVQRRISRLGAINLAAIDEFSQLEERKTYLDSQHADLSSALQTLEDAMRTIDKETRTRFKETFEQVNSKLKEMFPRLFGGGHAYMELVGDDLLEAGVTVMARPPGKRNSTIHLLSGGEKALTAIAFVFAIFELAPAPFCLLDEVDAPLDDNNVTRLADMLQEMSEQVQFAIVTHNKITMEIADRLLGVTMNEPGVSRLVSVSVEEAVELAESA